MDFQLFSHVVLALMVVLIIVFLYEADKLWKFGERKMAVLCAVLAVICAAGTSALYGDTIRAIFGK